MRHLVVGQALGQAAIFAVTPILTRIYSPTDIGFFQVLFFAASAISIVLLQRMDVFIPAAKGPLLIHQKQKQAITIAAAVSLVAVTVTAVTYPVFLTPILSTSVMALALATQTLENAVLLWARSPITLGLRNAISGVTTAILQVAFGMLSANLLSLALALAIGRMAAHLLVRRPTGARSLESIENVPSRGVRVANSIAALLGTLSGNVLVVLISLTLGNAAAGYVALAQRVSSAPITLVGQGIAQGVAHTIGENLRENRPLTPALHSIQLRLLRVGALFAVLGSSSCILLMDAILGPGWETVSPIAATLCIAGGMQIASSPLTGIFPMLGMHRTQLALEISKTSLITFAILYATRSSSDLLTVTSAAAAILIAHYSLTILSIRRACFHHDKRTKNS